MLRTEPAGLNVCAAAIHRATGSVDSAVLAAETASVRVCAAAFHGARISLDAAVFAAQAPGLGVGSAARPGARSVRPVLAAETPGFRVRCAPRVGARTIGAVLRAHPAVFRCPYQAASEAAHPSLCLATCVRGPRQRRHHNFGRHQHVATDVDGLIDRLIAYCAVLCTQQYVGLMCIFSYIDTIYKAPFFYFRYECVH